MAATSPANSPERPATHDRSKPPPPKVVSIEEMKQFTREELELRALTDKIMTIADGINSNGILTRGELETGLGGRPDFDHFAGWLFANGAKKWRKYDVDKSGTINVDELREIVREYCEEAEQIRERAARALDVVMKAITIIANKTGKELGTSLWFSLFKQFDTDGTGRISKDELTELIRKTLQIPVKQLKDEEIGHLWIAIEVDGDGTLEVEEFANFMDGNWVGKPSFFGCAGTRETAAERLPAAHMPADPPTAPPPPTEAIRLQGGAGGSEGRLYPICSGEVGCVGERLPLGWRDAAGAS